MEQFGEALWEESLYSCLKILESKDRVGFISFLNEKGIGPQPLRQKLTTALAKAKRAGKFGHVTPPAWEYVPQMPTQPAAQNRRSSRTMSRATEVAEQIKGAVGTALERMSAAAVAASSSNEPMASQGATKDNASGGEREARGAVPPPPPLRTGHSPCHRRIADNSPLAMRYPSMELGDAIHAGSALPPPSDPSERLMGSRTPPGALSGVTILPDVAEPTRILDTVSSLWRRMTRGEYSSVATSAEPQPTTKQVALGLL